MVEELHNLALRVRASDGPDASLDCDIHWALFGGKAGRELGFALSVANERFYTCPETGHGLSQPIRFTTSVEDAEKALPGPDFPEWQITRRYCTGYHANVGLSEDGVGCATPALALLDAALLARLQAKSRGEG